MLLQKTVIAHLPVDDAEMLEVESPPPLYIENIAPPHIPTDSESGGPPTDMSAAERACSPEHSSPTNKRKSLRDRLTDLETEVKCLKEMAGEVTSMKALILEMKEVQQTILSHLGLLGQVYISA